VNNGGVNFIEDLFTYHADFRLGWIYQAARRVVLEIELVIFGRSIKPEFQSPPPPPLIWSLAPERPAFDLVPGLDTRPH